MAGRKSERRANPSVEGVIGRRVRERRLSLGMSMGELAEQIGVTYQQVQKYETGADRVAFSRMVEIAAALDVDLSYFVDGHGRPRAAEKYAFPRGWLGLVRAYSRIRNAKLRKQALAMVKALAESA